MKFILGYLKPYAGRCVLFVLLTVLSVLFTMATALSVADFLRILFDTGIDLPVSQGNLLSAYLDQLYRWLIGFGQLKALLLFSAIIFVLYALKNVFGYLSKLEIAVVRTYVVRDLRNRLFDRVMRLPMSYFDSNRKGDIMSRFGSDMAEMEESTINSVQALIGAVISLLLYMVMLVYLSPQLTLFVLCMLPLVALSAGLVSRRLRRQSKEVQEMNSTLVSMTDEAISGLKVIKSYTAIEFSNSRFAHFNHSYAHLRTAMFRRIMSASPVSDFMGNVIVVGILLFGSYLIFGGNTGLTAELFISYIMLFVLMIPPVKDLTTSFSQMRKGRACVDRIQALLTESEEPAVVQGEAIAFDPDPAAPVVEFGHVDFSYVKGIQVLSDFNLSIPRGHTVALVGSSGSGKSTVADLVGRYYLASAGEIRFCGRPINQIPLSELRGHIGVVAQETLLFNDTVRANIAFGCPDASDADIERAARAAQAHDFIMQLPNGYQTNLGENGGLLSGGQRQRISIARALLRKPDLLVLDEATSALDTEAERRLQQTLDTLLQGNTALVIAHRLSTVRHADQIIVLDQGRVVERGTHSELMALGGRYAELVALQVLQDTDKVSDL